MSAPPDASHAASSQTSPGDSGDTPPPPAIYTRTSCDLCKRMKIRCERQGESCVHCIARGARCDMTFIKRKKQQPKRTSSNALQEVESRLKRLESVLTASGMDPSRFVAGDDGGTEGDDLPAAVADRLATLVIVGNGRARFVGPSSGFSLFSPQGLQWISEKVGASALSDFLAILAQARVGEVPLSNADLWNSIPAAEREPLPPRELVDVFVANYFGTFQATFPIFDRATFNEHYNRQYAGRPTGGTAWYACICVVIAIGSMMWHAHGGALDGSPTAHHDAFPHARSWTYFRSACGCLVDLMFNDCSLMAVQAICGIALVHQTTLDPQSFYVLTASAGRLAYGLGLHRQLDHFGLSEAESDQRRNLFWIIYYMDKSISLRVGHPSVMHDDDIGVDLPRERHPREMGPNGTPRFDIFRCQVELAMLESRVNSELYSFRARSKPDLERLRSVGRLDTALEEWRDKLPVEIRPGEPIRCANDQVVPVMMLHFAYFNSLITVHRVTNTGSWTTQRARKDWQQQQQQQSGAQLNPRVYASHSICLAAARSTIELLNLVGSPRVGPGPRERLVWMMLYYPLCGFLTLFANILQNPMDSYVPADLQLMQVVRAFVPSELAESNPFSSGPIMKVFHELLNLAEAYVEKIRFQGMNRAKRARGDENPAETPWQPLPVDPGAAGPTVLPVTPPYPAAAGPIRSTHHPSASQLPSSDARYPPLHAQPDPLLHAQPGPYGISQPGYGAATPMGLATSTVHYQNMMSDLPVFGDSFEWDLANLWNSDLVPNF